MRHVSEAATQTPFALKVSDKWKTGLPAQAKAIDALTNHVVGNMDLDLSLILKSHLALDALVCLFLFGNKKEETRWSGKDQKEVHGRPDSICPRQLHFQRDLFQSLLTSLQIQLSTQGKGG